MGETRALWIVPEERGGIRTYAEALLPAMGKSVCAIWTLPEPPELSGSDAEIIHLQHEFGLFGSKLPGLYRFPKWFAHAREQTPGKKWIATAHTVLGPEWKYRTAGQGLKSIPFTLLNLFGPLIRKTRMEKTWSGFDGVIVHSEKQRAIILKSGCPQVAVIPHYVPTSSSSTVIEPTEPTVLLFGYFSPEKGQDVAIRAWASLGAEAPKLILAGGVRRPEDRAYHAMCVDSIRRAGLEKKIEITGYVPTEKVSDLFARATFVLAPFRETSGSGSLATALGYGAAVLASDLPLNREIEERIPGALAFFHSESPESLAQEVRSLMADSNLRSALRSGARRYADAHSVEKIAALHWKFYLEVLGGGSR